MQFIKYAMVGVTGVVVDFTLFYILTEIIGINYLIANIASVCAGITNNFIWNMHFTFKKTDQMLIRFVKFFSVGLIGLGVSSGILYVLVDVLTTPTMIAKAITLIIITLLQYNLNRNIAFK